MQSAPNKFLKIYSKSQQIIVALNNQLRLISHWNKETKPRNDFFQKKKKKDYLKVGFIFKEDKCISVKGENKPFFYLVPYRNYLWLIFPDFSSPNLGLRIMYGNRIINFSSCHINHHI